MLAIASLDSLVSLDIDASLISSLNLCAFSYHDLPLLKGLVQVYEYVVAFVFELSLVPHLPNVIQSVLFDICSSIIMFVIKDHL